MSFIGVMTGEKKENEFKRIFIKFLDSIGEKHTVIFLNENNIDNMKNIKFEVIILDTFTIKNKRIFQKIISNSRIVAVNTDNERNLKSIINLKLIIVTYGINSKSTVTVSSANDDYILISLQRNVKTLKNTIIEPQEIKIKSSVCHNNLEIALILANFSIFFCKI